MKFLWAMTILIGSVMGLAACGGSGNSPAATPLPSSPTPGAPARTALAALAGQSPRTGGPTPIASSADPSKLSVSGGALGAQATATMHTTPGAQCSIVYTHPSGKASTALGLDPQTAGADGTVTWTWLISPNTVPTGTGTVVVTCGADIASTTITIGPKTN